ncbi:uncharacterized protein LOC115091938 isoform X3 [Rhinatrema bivittatum]|uniref:uncharacterized protein LOC115091938 isoform X3 n=1 Tax=Rhinatrema bivittatum TaxID=194408 RepID=UPI0011293F57|nr:uncharacterized protein LOC115091938 isoform X3 [Rhinatrema bivittatum]
MKGQNTWHFLHRIELLSGWPTEKLPYNNQRICAYTYFRPGTVITKDSKASSKIYVIKTGTVRVLKAMTPPKPQNSSKRYKELLNSEELLPGFLSKREHGNDKNSFSSSLNEEEYLLPILQRERKPTKQESTASRDCNGVAAINSTATTKIMEEGEALQMYIHIQTLRAGDVFGLVYTVLEDTLSMALVSDGAECILISKQFFKKYMDEDYRYKLSTTVQPYPSKELLQEKMQDYVNWMAYRSLLVNKSH